MNKKIKIIYGNINCHKCIKAKNKYSDAEYIDINSLPNYEKDAIMKKLIALNIKSIPIFVDEHGNFLTSNDIEGC